MCIRDSRTPEQIKGELNKDQLAVYELIYKRTLASQMNDEIGETKRVILEAEKSDQEIYHATFSATGRTITHSGFKQIYEEAPNISNDQESTNILPDLSEGDLFSANEIVINNHETKPPARFTEASLVKWMEEAGIGRPSTFAATISKIQAREYTHKDGRALIPTAKAFVATNFYENEFKSEVQYEYTANLNKELDRIADGALDRDDFLNEWYFEETGWESRIDDILNQIKIDLPRIRHEAAYLVGEDPKDGQNIYLRFANQKPYVQLSVDGETGSIPPALPLDELTIKKAREFIELASQPDTILGWVDKERAKDLLDTNEIDNILGYDSSCLLYTSPSQRDRTRSRMPSSA